MDMERLSRENRGLLYRIAAVYRDVCNLDRATDIEDLIQAGQFGLWAAAETYDPNGGKSWAGWAAYFIKREMRAALGIATSRRRADLGAISIDAPAYADDPDSDPLKDTLADDSLPAVDSDAIMHDMQRQVREAVGRIKDEKLRDIIQASYFEGQTQGQIAEHLGCSPQYVAALRKKAYRKLRADRRLAACLLYETPYYRHVGVEQFHRTQTSAVENAVLWREKIKAYYTQEACCKQEE